MDEPSEAEIKRLAERAHDRMDQLVGRVHELRLASVGLLLRTLVTINGGAAIAIIAFAGKSEMLRQVASSLLCFAWGVALGTFMMGGVWLQNRANEYWAASLTRVFREPYHIATSRTSKWKWMTHFAEFLTIILGIASLAAFVLGVYFLRASLTG